MKNDNNQINDFIVRWYDQEKKNNPKLTWADCSEAVYKYFGKDLTANACKNRYWRLTFTPENTREEQPEQLMIDDPAFQEKIEKQKERYKKSDERIQVNALVRRISREETIKEIFFRNILLLVMKKEKQFFRSATGITGLLLTVLITSTILRFAKRG